MQKKINDNNWNYKYIGLTRPSDPWGRNKSNCCETIEGSLCVCLVVNNRGSLMIVATTEFYDTQERSADHKLRSYFLLYLRIDPKQLNTKTPTM